MAGAVRGDVVVPTDLTPAERTGLFDIMDLVYTGMTRDAFERDLDAKDEVIVLRADGALVGFSSQRRLIVDGVAGIFSGDTVIHPDHRGSPALVRAFAQRYIFTETPDGRPLAWFLVSKGHRTYRMLPTFFRRYWPSRLESQPDAASRLMRAYAEALFPGDYNPGTGVLEYRTAKDRLRDTGLTERDLADPDVAFFAARNTRVGARARPGLPDRAVAGQPRARHGRPAPWSHARRGRGR